MPASRPNAASRAPTGPGATSGVNPRLPRRATRHGARGLRAPRRAFAAAHPWGALSRGDGRRIRGAVVVSGWLVCGDSWVESPPRAGYPLDDSLAPPAPRSPRLGSIPDKYGYQRSASAPRIAALADVPSRFAP